MSLFDPNDYLKGGSGTATAPAAEFDPVLYLSGRPQNEAKQPNGSPQQAEPSPVEAPIPPKRPKGLDWPKILNGKIEEIASRVSPEQAEALSRLPDPEAKAGAVMRAWAHDQYPQMRPDDIDHNWDTVRPLIAKNAFGVDNPKMSNSAFYGLVAKHTEEEQGFRASLPEALANVPTAAAKHLKEWYTKPAIELPEAPKDTPDIPGLGLQNPALWAGVYNGAVRPFVSFVESPEGMTFLAGGAELKALSEAYPAAKVALSGISGLFGYMMGSQTIKDAPEVVSIFKDPKSTFQQRVEVVSKEISNASLTLLASFGAIEELGGAKDLQTQLKGLDVPKSVEEDSDAGAAAQGPQDFGGPLACSRYP